MYLLVRQANLRGGMDAQQWAIDIGAAAASGLGNEVGVWSTVLSPGVGTISWTTRWENLSALEKGFAELFGNAKYLELAGEGTQYVNGPIDDTLYESVYEGVDDGVAPNDVRYVGTVTAVIAPGNFARGMMGGVEIAQRVEKATGVSTGFMAGQTGSYGRVLWLGGYESMAEFEKAQHDLAADTSFVEFIDATTGAYQPDPVITQSTVYMRLN